MATSSRLQLIQYLNNDRSFFPKVAHLLGTELAPFPSGVIAIAANRYSLGVMAALLYLGHMFGGIAINESKLRPMRKTLGCNNGAGEV